MPPHRTPRSRHVDDAPTDIESDSGETEYDDEPTPKPQRKKRVSEAAFDASLTSDPGRLQAQRSININDDAAEKRRRRKSARTIVPDEDNEAGPSTEDTRAAAHARQKQQLLSVAEAPAIDVPLDVMNSNFEEWMKMATDNVRLYCRDSSECQTTLLRSMTVRMLDNMWRGWC
jgi:condensin complex subunit 2